ncbi:hypothetical protein DSM43518_02035 [Mycobacterium marinum]|nr:hypothetical protein DSM43518_02035 [Mycobacterium marinum]
MRTQAKPSAGARLVAELSKPDDPYSLTLLIEQAGHTADYLQRLHELIDGDRDAWLQLNLGAKTVEVIVNKPLAEARAQSEQLRKFLAEIHRQRAAITEDPGEDDVLDDDGDD